MEVLESIGGMADWIRDRYSVLVSERSGKSIGVECMQHRPGHTTSACVTLWPDGGQTFKCWSCDFGPFDAIDLVVALGEVNTKGEAIRMLGEQSGALTTTGFGGRKQHSSKPKPKPNLEPIEDTDQRPDTATAVAAKTAYLTKRRWSEATWDRHGLEVVYRCGRVAIRHPFRIDGEVYNWQDRMPKSFGGPRWLSAKGGLLIPFNVDALADRARDYVHIVEGPADAVTVTEMMFGDYPVIAAPGASTWRPEWGAFAKGKTVIVTGDNDEAGAKFIAKVVESVTGDARFIGSVQPPDEHKDIGDWWVTEGNAAGDAIVDQLEWIGRAGRSAQEGFDR